MTLESKTAQGKQMLFRPFFLIVICMVFVIASGESQGTESLTLDDCLALAYQNQPALSAIREDVHVAQENIDVARSYYFPQVKASASLTAIDEVRSFEIDGLFTGQVGDVFADAATFFQISRLGGTSVALNGLDNPNSGLFPGGPTFNSVKQQVTQSLPQSTRVDVLGEAFVNTQIGLVQPIWTAGRIRSRVEQASCGLRLAKYSQQRARQSLRINVSRAYYSVLLSRHLQEVASEVAESVKLTEVRLKRLFESGDLRITRSQILKVQSAQRVLQSQVVALQVAEKRAQVALMQAMGFRQTDQLSVARQPLQFDRMDVSEATLLSAAISNRPELRQANVAVKLVQLEKGIANAEFYPEIVGFGQMNTIHDDRGFANPNDEIEWAVGIAASLTLANGGRRVANVRIAKHELAKAYANQKVIRQAVEQEVSNAYLNLDRAKRSLSLSHDAYQSSKDASRILQQNEDAGIIAKDEGREHVEDKLVTAFLYAKAGADFYQDLFSYNLAVEQLRFATATDLERLHVHERSAPITRSLTDNLVAGGGVHSGTPD